MVSPSDINVVLTDWFLRQLRRTQEGALSLPPAGWSQSTALGNTHVHYYHLKKATAKSARSKCLTQKAVPDSEFFEGPMPGMPP